MYAVHRDDAGKADAYAVYWMKHDWPRSVPSGTITVQECVASTPSGNADIWRYLFDVDLVATVEAWNRPVGRAAAPPAPRAATAPLLRERRVCGSGRWTSWRRSKRAGTGRRADRVRGRRPVPTGERRPVRALASTAGSGAVRAPTQPSRPRGDDQRPRSDVPGRDELPPALVGGAGGGADAGFARPGRCDVRVLAGPLVRRRLLTSSHGPFVPCAGAQRRGRLPPRTRWEDAMPRHRQSPPLVEASPRGVALLLVCRACSRRTGRRAYLHEERRNDSASKIDLRSVSVSHTSTGVVHTVRTWNSWTPASLEHDSFFLIEINKDNDAAYERCAFIFYTNRLRGSALELSGRSSSGTCRREASNATTAKITIPKSQLGHGVLVGRGRASGSGRAPCRNVCRRLRAQHASRTSSTTSNRPS